MQIYLFINPILNDSDLRMYALIYWSFRLFSHVHNSLSKITMFKTKILLAACILSGTVAIAQTTPQKKPAVHLTPLNHIGLWIDDLPTAVEWLTAQGLRFTPGGIRRGGDGHDIIFVHPKSSHEFPIAGSGVLVELVQAPEEMIQSVC